MRCAPPAAALIEQHDAIGAWIEQPSEPGRTTRPRATVKDEGGLAARVATCLPGDEIAISHIQHPVLVWFDLGIQRPHLGQALFSFSGILPWRYLAWQGRMA